MVLCIIMTFILSFITVTICAFCFKQTIYTNYVQNLILLLITLIFGIIDKLSNKNKLNNEDN